MSLDILDSKEVIKLNALWQGYDIMTVRAAFTFLCSEQDGERPGFAIDYETIVDEHGNHVALEYALPVSLEDWMKLPVREGDLSVGIGFDRETGLSRRVRVPRMVICANYDRLPEKTVRWSPAAVRERDKGVCQVTKVKLAPHEGDTGHWVAAANGGRKTFDNTYYMRKDLNRKQGTKTPVEMGWSVSRPKAPKARVKILRAEDACHPSQVPFLLK